MVYVILRYNKWANPVPSTRTHNVPLEIIWTLLPCVVLAGIAWISFLCGWCGGAVFFVPDWGTPPGGGYPS